MCDIEVEKERKREREKERKREREKERKREREKERKRPSREVLGKKLSTSTGH